MGTLRRAFRDETAATVLIESLRNAPEGWSHHALEGRGSDMGEALTVEEHSPPSGRFLLLLASVRRQ